MEVVNYKIKLDIDFAGKKYTGTENVKIKEADNFHITSYS